MILPRANYSAVASLIVVSLAVSSNAAPDWEAAYAKVDSIAHSYNSEFNSCTGAESSCTVDLDGQSQHRNR
jgi:hypothetical protein